MTLYVRDIEGAMKRTESLWMGISPYTTSKSLVALVVVYFTIRAIYRLTLHPLANFPGPKLCAISDLWYARTILSGRLHERLKELHEEYGSVIRITPTSLSFSSVRAHDDIYTFSSKSLPFLKNTFYDGAALKNDSSRSMLTIKDPAAHAQVRRMFSANFSPQALKKQEPFIQTHMTETVEKLRSHELRGEAVEMSTTATYVGFDVASELSFGQSFGAIQSKSGHFWIKKTTDMFIAMVVFDVMRRYFVLSSLIKVMATLIQTFNPSTAKIKNYSTAQMQRRLANDPAIPQRSDLFADIIKDGKSDFTLDQLRVHASSFILAGSQSTGNLMLSVFYFLLKNPEKYNKLVAEIRSSFDSEADIRLETSELPYLSAVIDESQRLFPVFPLGSPRDSPGAMVDGVFVPRGTEVSVCPWSMLHSPALFHKPTEFVPERWLEKSPTDVLAASKPFSSGPRNCVGRYLAIFETRLLLCKVLFNFNIQPDDPEEFAQVDWVREKKNYIFWEHRPLQVRFHAVRSSPDLKN